MGMPRPGKPPQPSETASHLEYGAERRHEHDGKVYRIRDVWSVSNRLNGRVLARCEYATKEGRRGQTVWHPCREGVSFAEIEPFEQVSH